MIPASIQNGNGKAMAAQGRFLLVLFTILLISLAVFYAISIPHHTVTGHAAEAGVVYINGEMVHRAGQLGITDKY